ncbi:MAG: hypothetical protein COZ09_11385, partial [Comamonadaceae bacterium CG_4_10_14_3_um_filter_60_42]
MNKSQLNFRPLSWLMAPVLSVALVACGGGGQDTILGSGGIAPVVVVPPTVTNVTPLRNATGVATNTKTITATFSQAMDSDTLTADSFTLACPAATPITGGTVSYLPASRMATLTLPAGTVLASGALCDAAITTAAKDSTGLALAKTFPWQFTTGKVADLTAPTVTNTLNAEGATTVAINTRVSATFSEALDPLSVDNTSYTLKQTATGEAVTGTTSYSGVDAVFIPSAPLLAGTQYTATIKSGATGVVDLAGNPLAKDYVWNWTTATSGDTTPPTVGVLNPAKLATDVCTNKTINATFSEPMDPLTLNNSTFTLKATSGAL